MSVCCRSQESACVCVCVCVCLSVSLSLSLVRMAMAEFIENLQTKAPWEGRWWASSSSGIAGDSQRASELPAQGKRSLVDGGK
jgi:hypothetical protein